MRTGCSCSMPSTADSRQFQLNQCGSHKQEKGLRVPNGDREQKGSGTEEVRSEGQQEEEEEEKKVLPDPRQGTHFSPCRWPFPRELQPWRAHAGAGERCEKEKTPGRNSRFWTVTAWPVRTAQESLGRSCEADPGKGGLLSSLYIYIILLTSSCISN